MLTPHLTWPSQGDCLNPLVLLGQVPTDTTVYAALLQELAMQRDAVVAAVSTRTGWVPFLADPAPSPRLFTSTDGYGVLDLAAETGAGLVDVVNNPPVVTVSGSAYVLNTQFWLMQANAGNMNEPYGTLYFNSTPGLGWGTWWTTPNQIVITGRWGYAASVPADLWNAVRGEVAARALNGLAVSAPIMTSRSQEGFSASFDIGRKLAERIETWTATFDAVVDSYMRVVV